MDTKPLTPEKMAQIKELLKELDISPSNHSLIQDNKIIFDYENKFYTIRMPNQNEQSLADQEQNKFKIKLIQEDGTITRKRLIKVLKEKQDIDIAELDKKKEELQKELQDVYMELAIIGSEDEEQIETVREKKNAIEEKFMEITIEVIEMLSPCIEEQVRAFYYKYLSYLCTSKQIGEDKTEKIWNSFEEYGKDGTGLTYRAIQNLQSLLLSVKE